MDTYSRKVCRYSLIPENSCATSLENRGLNTNQDGLPARPIWQVVSSKANNNMLDLWQNKPSISTSWTKFELLIYKPWCDLTWRKSLVWDTQNVVWVHVRKYRPLDSNINFGIHIAINRCVSIEQVVSWGHSKYSISRGRIIGLPRQTSNREFHKDLRVWQ